MAILNNLIVHGRSRFLNGINANTINAKSIGANKGVFNELIATTLNVETATIDDLTAQNATVVGLLDVRGELKTNTWSNSNIATIEGNFFIAPTLASGTGETLVSGLTIGFASNNWTITITGTFDLNQIGADPVDSSDTATNQWSVGSKVLITGEIGKTDGIYPLGTLMGEIQSASPSSFTITKVTDNLGKTDILSTLGTGTYQYRNVKISLTQRKYGSSSTASDNMRPIGILMSAQGRSSKSFIDIYGGANNLRSGAISGATTDFGGLAIPNVRIGNLRGLPNVVSGDFTQNESLPTGWGIYTDNGYFKGTIVSTSGKIGGWNIGTDNNKSLYTGTFNTGGGIFVSPSKNGVLSIAGTTAKDWAFTAGTNFGVTTDGKLYASGAELSGNVAATQGFTVTSTVGGQTIASMTGGGISLGPITNTSHYNILIDTSGIKLRYDTTILNLIDSTGMTLKNSSGSTLAEFKSYINLGTEHTNTYTGSAAIGVGLTVTKTNQVVVGRYNESNSNATFIIGDGTGLSDKSNLLTVGNIAGKQITDTFVGDGETKIFTLSNIPSGTVTALTTGYSIDSYDSSDNTITLDKNVTNGEQFQCQYTTNEKSGYLIVGNINNIHGKGAIVGGYIDNSTMTASGIGSSIHGYAIGGSTMTASGNGSSIHGYPYGHSTMIASDHGCSIYGYIRNNCTMTALGAGSSIHGYAASESIMTAGSSGSSIYGNANESTMVSSGLGSSIHGYANESTMEALLHGASIYGHAYNNSTMTASGRGSSIHGYASNSSTMTASNSGSLIYGTAYNSTIVASGTGSSIHGYVHTGTMTASGDGSLVHGFVYDGTMTASGDGSIALNEATHAIGRAQLAIGTYNEDDSTATTTHPSETSDYGTYAFIIGNGTAENARSNALTVDWNGNVDIASGAKYKINGTALSASDVSAIPNNGGTITQDSSSPATYALTVNDGNSNALTVDWDGNVEAAGDIYPQNTLMADFVVERGTSGNWTYTKWNSGKCEQWYVGNPGSYTVGTTRGQLRSGGYLNYTYPVAFTAAPSVTVNATLTTDTYVVWAQASNHSNTGISVRIVASANIAANSSYSIHIHAVGTWK